MNLIFPLKDFDIGNIDNTFFFSENISENYENDIDQLFQSFLNLNKNKEIVTFTLPLNLSNNFMEFSGLIFAHHVRLSRELKFCNAPIIFYGVLELEQILRLTSLARILLTDNVLYVNMVKYSFQDIQRAIKKYRLKPFDLNRFIDQIQLIPPSNYNSHHGIDNEFALIQWSNYIGCFDRLPQQFRKEFVSNLYFKYLKAKNSIFAFGEYNPIKISSSENTRILLVDDEAYKGWKSFYESFFHNSNVEFEDSGIDFKNKDKDELIKMIESKVREFKPHIILLDIRLHDSDFEQNILPECLTGIELLEKIKTINSGIQILITTASNKAWNYNLAKQKGAYDFIIKDGFENPEYSLKRLVFSIEIAAKRAIFLKNVRKRINLIIKLINENPQFDYNEKDGLVSQIENNNILRNKFLSDLNSAFALLDISCEDPNKLKYYSYCYLQLFICIEEFVNLESVFEIVGDQSFVIHSLKRICVSKRSDDTVEQAIKFNKNNNGKYIIEKCSKKFIRLDTNFLVSSILIFKYGNENSSENNWTKVYKQRNEIVHEGSMPNENQIFDLLDFIRYFFNAKNENSDNLDKGLIPISDEEKLQLLKQKINTSENGKSIF
ncbi:MAG: response regulator [Flavobacteriales bacterium]|nr:response regulator [Flavobacteriales bacterium]